MQRPPEQDPTDDEVPTVALEDDVVSAFSSGTIVGQRYRIGTFLGRGGMGEVWQAFDLKLRVDVALKTVRRERFPEDQALAMLRREARSAREVVSPNVCRIFDLVEIEDQELVSMEYIDGTTLLSVLRERGPLELREATEIAAQLLAGLEAIHRAGLVHRDVKPENVMMTRSGRVVLMDFGLAKPQVDAGRGRAAGTPAYMSPEQMRGDRLDARTDIFAAGVLLAEMIHAKGIRERESRDTLHRGLHRDPPDVPPSPWRPVLLRAIAPDPEDRYPSARELVRALEEVALRVDGAEVLRPYPGLASFTETDAEYFFGREVEIETVWKTLRRPHLLALIGPSGAGKTSFLHAGLLPAMPEGWRCIVCQPGDAAMPALGRVLVPELAGDPDAIGEMARFEDPDVAVALFGGWRKRHRETLLIVDQFEELFTLNPPEAQTRFAELIGRLAVEADVHVLLSLRDDFLLRCHEQPALGPLFSGMTPLGAPTGAALRRALVQPALKCGHRFEDATLVDEMLEEVADERGALPLLAFAVARLWEERDRETGRLTREAYRRIGGVGGALAHHAESTLERIGTSRVPIVREMFRNLVTAQGTRAARDAGELLTVFEDREPAREVLRVLIDARLLTSFEVCPDEGEAQPRQRIEIIHESLLTAWPRLVRWRTQDADGAQLRDQLRQAAKTWDERGRPGELLWRGTTFREFQVWRERYPGGLTAIEDAYAHAMVLAAGRRRRRVRGAVVSSFVVLLGVLALVFGLWRQSNLEARRAKAAALLAEGRLEIDHKGHLQWGEFSVTGPSVALAHALASLELSDTTEARRFVLEALWREPTAIYVPDSAGGVPTHVTFSPDGRWLAASYLGEGPTAKAGEEGSVRLWSSDGGDAIVLFRAEPSAPHTVVFGPDSDLLISMNNDKTMSVWSVPDGTLLRTLHFDHPAKGFVTADGRLLIAGKSEPDSPEWCWQSSRIDGGGATSLGCVGLPGWWFNIDPAGKWLAYSADRDVFVVPLDDLEGTEPRLVGHHEAAIGLKEFGPQGDRLAAVDDAYGVRVWSTLGGPDGPLHSFHGAGRNSNLWYARTGSLLATGGGEVHLWDLSLPPEANPVVFGRTATEYHSMAFHPEGSWLAVSDEGGIVIYPLDRPRQRILRGHEQEVTAVVFLHDGRSFASASGASLRLWPLPSDPEMRGRPVEVRAVETRGLWGLAADPLGRFVAATGNRAWLVPIGEAPPRPVTDFEWCGADMSPSGRLAAFGGTLRVGERGALGIWDLETGVERILDSFEVERFAGIRVRFLSESELLASREGVLRLWDLDSGDSQVVIDGGVKNFELSPDGRHVLTFPSGLRRDDRYAVIHDLETGTSRELTSHGTEVRDIAFDPTGSMVATVSWDGIVRVGPASDEPPHLMLGHEGSMYTVAISRDGRWIATGGDDGTVRLWPMPGGQPLHTLPYDDLLDRLRTLTNIRVVEDEASSTGYRLEIDRFPGWATTPES